LHADAANHPNPKSAKRTSCTTSTSDHENWVETATMSAMSPQSRQDVTKSQVCTPLLWVDATNVASVVSTITTEWQEIANVSERYQNGGPIAAATKLRSSTKLRRDASRTTFRCTNAGIQCPETMANVSKDITTTNTISSVTPNITCERADASSASMATQNEYKSNTSIVST